MEKIASPLRSVLHRLQKDGVTVANSAGRDLKSYSTPLVRVDQNGSIQTVISVVDVNDAVESLLEQHQVRIEIEDAESRLIQAWIPFDRLERVAALSVVRFIRPPSYAVRR